MDAKKMIEVLQAHVDGLAAPGQPAALKAAAEQEPICYTSKIQLDTVKASGFLYAETKKTQTYKIPLYTHPIASEDSEDAARYREFFKSGLPITFCGVGHYTKEALDAAIDAARREGK